MPEGDTVYRQCAMLREALAGRTIVSCDFRVPSLATSDVSGRTVLDVVPRGKHILVRLSAAPDPGALRSGSEPLTLHCHLMMDGTWRVFDASPATASPARGKRPGYRRPAGVRSRAETVRPLSHDVARGHGSHTVRVVLRTADVEAVGFDVKDVRLVPTALETRELVGHLGPDILGPDWDLDEALSRLRARPDRPVASALLDQRNLAGIGNVYRVEVLFMTHTDPWAPVGSLPAGKLREIVVLAHKLLHLNRDRPLRSTIGEAPRGRPLHWAYGRDGRPCRRCGALLRAGEIDDAALSPAEPLSATAPHHPRRIMWCPRCQDRPEG